MASTTVRVKQETRAALRELVRETNQPIQELVAQAVELYRRQLILERTNTVFGGLRADGEAWAEERAEREAWDAALSDGLEHE